MKKLICLFTLSFLVLSFYSVAQTGDDVGAMFNTKCGICHKIGGGKFIGPDLANVHERRDMDWLVEYIRSSQTMINNGDEEAVKLFEEYNKVVMPDPMISDNEIRSLISYIAENSAGGVGVAVEQVSVIENATAEDWENGKLLFEGRVRFKNNGPSCISCHNDVSNIYFFENSYSTKDVSKSFADLGEMGVKAILESPPFPVMAKAFEGHDLEENEVHDLLVYLQSSGTQRASVEMSSGYLLYGILGAVGMFFLYGSFWYKRKSRSVNHSIYKRQIKSTN